MKFCKDCIYFRDTILGQCAHQELGVDIVHGTQKTRFARDIRSDNTKCGPLGEWYETKNTKYVPTEDTPPVVRWVKTLFSRSAE